MAGTLKHCRVVTIKMALGYLCHEAGKLRNGLDPAIKAMTLILSLKTHVVTKREIYSKERFKDKENL